MAISESAGADDRTNNANNRDDERAAADAKLALEALRQVNAPPPMDLWRLAVIAIGAVAVLVLLIAVLLT